MTDLRAPSRDERPGDRPDPQDQHSKDQHRPERRRGPGLFRAFWRWHFYASFLVVPVLLVLATTGLIYLFRFQLEPMLHPALMKVEQPPHTIAQPYVSQLALVDDAYPGSTAVSLTEPKDAHSPTVVSILTADGESRDVYVNPFGPEVLGSLDPDETLSGYAIRIHGGHGYSTEFDVERYYRDAPLMIVGEGTNEVLRNVVVKQLITRQGLT